MPQQLRRLLRVAAVGFAFIVYVWIAAVRNVGRVKRRKRLRRLSR